MNRRFFLQLPLPLGFAAMDARANEPSENRVANGFKVPAGRDRFDEELGFGGDRYFCKVSAKDTDEDLCIYEVTRMDKGGPAYHIHYLQDEWFYVLRGEFTFKIGHEMFFLKAGDSAFGPRKIPHAYAKTSEGEGKMVVVFQPARTIELFLKEAGQLRDGSQDALQKIFRKHEMEMLGPPLKYS
jgi:mannose-6-phosphate isomerase-like protein (cupin superfamily)